MSVGSSRLAVEDETYDVGSTGCVRVGSDCKFDVGDRVNDALNVWDVPRSGGDCWSVDSCGMLVVGH